MYIIFVAKPNHINLYTDDVLYQKIRSLLKNKILHTTMPFDYHL